ncbi:hypothetical protein [Halococcus saccharolyticus]|uniref:Small CPxCG-related zinc finger protein n=1 Tax=Halococcus saccharolyticus DSM 5350 TaxID=1227455 RepID=M0MQG7_9EURY|nr:hypothetical protein [Halococcus saccharolyticus]EMA47967.1 hypothetical protein C449_00805 [Halococcus saccharolyticus DSM 5350]
MTEQSQNESHHYPDGVLKSYCGDCGERFYARRHPSYCPYCGHDKVFNEGHGEVGHA